MRAQTIALLIVSALLIGACTVQDQKNNANMPNPASKFCEDQGGKLSIIEEAEGQKGICTLRDGTVCEEWAYFRGECPSECGECPSFSPPGPDFCIDGTVVPGTADECGCQSPPSCQRACTEEAKVCPDGTSVGRDPLNDCKFTPCPGEKKYVSEDPEQCKLVKFMCTAGTIPFFDESGCGCEPDTQGREYVATNVTVCAATDWICSDEQQQFFDSTGCGCEPKPSCGNGVCEPGEADTCPACYYEEPACLAPCTMGTCPQDCEASGKLKAIDCTDPRPKACTREYMPVCGQVQVQCIRAPCPPIMETFSNKCEACANELTISYTEGACESGEIPGATYCTAAQRGAVACTMEWAPVCGDNGKTYGNGCGACADSSVQYYTQGECS